MLNKKKLTLLLYMIVAVVGCDKGTYVTGIATLNDKPIEKGSIAFRPVDGKGTSFGAMIKNGEYIAEKAMPGKMVAVVTAIDKEKAAISREKYSELIKTHKVFSVDTIPQNAKGNNRTVEIKPGSQELDFHIVTDSSTVK